MATHGPPPSGGSISTAGASDIGTIPPFTSTVRMPSGAVMVSSARWDT